MISSGTSLTFNINSTKLKTPYNVKSIRETCVWVYVAFQLYGSFFFQINITFVGGFGAWIVSASREYHTGGPLKQELLVHQDSLMLNYFHSTHFGTPSQAAPQGWSKFYGPVLIYFNTGSDEEVLADVAIQAEIERSKWPYTWVEEDEYPLVRGSVTGKVTGQTKAMVVVYDSLEEEFDRQTLGYLYHTETDQDGGFIIENIRPGDYQVVAYPLAGQGSDNLARQNVTISPNGKLIFHVFKNIFSDVTQRFDASL